MITKYVVKDDSIYLYDGDDIIETLPNTTENIKLAKLYNNQIFVNVDLMKAITKGMHLNDVSRKEAIKWAITLIAMGASVFLQLQAITMIFSLMSLFKMLSFTMASGELRKCDSKIRYLKGIKEKIEEEIERIQTTVCNEKEENVQLAFSDEQIIADHRDWITKYGEPYSYSEDVDMINNAKILVRK